MAGAADYMAQALRERFKAKPQEYVQPAGTVGEWESYQQQNPIDRLAQEMPSDWAPVSEAQAATNRSQNARDLLSIVPGPGNVIAAEDAVAGAKDAAAAFGEGKYKQGTLQAALAGLSAFGAVTGLPTSRMAGAAAKGASSRTNLFAGPMAKNADHDALARAKDMHAEGVPREAIWGQTGWFKGTDGKWRFEIDDSAMGVKIPRDANFDSMSRYSTAVDHPELYAAYPGMKRDRIGFDGRIRDSEILLDVDPRAWNRQARDTTLGMKGTLNQQGQIRPEKLNEVRADAVHELQHNVQGRESFASGAEANMADLGPYIYSAGEVEARNVAKRLRMTAAERRAKAPWLTQDVPDEQQIIGQRYVIMGSQPKPKGDK